MRIISQIFINVFEYKRTIIFYVPSHFLFITQTLTFWFHAKWNRTTAKKKNHIIYLEHYNRWGMQIKWCDELSLRDFAQFAHVNVHLTYTRSLRRTQCSHYRQQQKKIVIKARLWWPSIFWCCIYGGQHTRRTTFYILYIFF